MDSNKKFVKTSAGKTLITSLLVLIAVIAVIAIIGYFALSPKELILQGEVEANEIRVSGKVPGRILELKVNEGERVDKGQILVYIDAPEIEAKSVQAMAAENAAKAVADKANNGTRKETIEGAKQQYEQAKAAANFAEQSYTRAKNLYAQGVMAAQKYDEIEAKYRAAIAQEKAAKSQYNMAVNGAQQEDKQAALAQVNRAKGAMMEVDSYKHETRLTAPISGEISEIFPKVGELVGTGSPIMSIVDLNDIWITFNVREDLLSKIHMGMEFSGKVPALGNKEIKLRVTYIKALASYATWKATKITDEYDTKTFEVKVVPVSKVSGLRPGMSVIVNWSLLK